MKDATLRDIADYLGEQRSRLEEVVAGIPARVRGLRPASDSWSVAEIVEHLGIVEARVTELVRSAASRLETRIAASPDVDVSGLDLGRLLDRSRKVQSAEGSRPQGDVTAEAGLDILRERRRALLVAMAETDGLPLESVIFPHPAIGPMNLYQWLRFIGAHEARHTEQIVETARAVAASARTGPTAPS